MLDLRLIKRTPACVLLSVYKGVRNEWTVSYRNRIVGLVCNGNVVKNKGLVMTKKIKLDKQDEQYIKEMMEMYGLTRDQAIKQLGVLRAHGF